MLEQSKTNSRRIRFGASYLFLVVVGVTMVFPFLWMIKTSLQSPKADVRDLKMILPAETHPENYKTVVQELEFKRSLFNRGDNDDRTVRAHVGGRAPRIATPLPGERSAPPRAPAGHDRRDA